MADIIRLKNGFEEEVEFFVNLVRDNKITHSVMLYRMEDGNIGYTYLGGDHMTYLIGLMDRIKHRLHLHKDSISNWDDVD